METVVRYDVLKHAAAINKELPHYDPLNPPVIELDYFEVPVTVKLLTPDDHDTALDAMPFGHEIVKCIVERQYKSKIMFAIIRVLVPGEKALSEGIVHIAHALCESPITGKAQLAW